MKKLAIITLEYMEEDYKQTLECLKALIGVTSLGIYFASRDGVGNMSRAFNNAFCEHVQGRYEYVWFLTNVTFAPDVPLRLVDFLDASGYAAVHPACNSSDHVHLHKTGTLDVQPVPFVELMAPMFRAADFALLGFQEDLWYWYMDLVISYELRQRGKELAVDRRVEVQHTYLRHMIPSPITRIRKELREVMKGPGQKWLVDKYGPDWRKVLGWKE